jgi:hypothetical protein
MSDDFLLALECRLILGLFLAQKRRSTDSVAAVVGGNGLGLHAFELEVLQVGLVGLRKVGRQSGWGRNLHVESLHEVLHNHPIRIGGARMQNKSCQAMGLRPLLRVAASSIPPLHADVPACAVPLVNSRR